MGTAETPCSSLLTDLRAPSCSMPPRETLSLHWLMRISSHSPMYHPHSYPGQYPPCVNQSPNPAPHPHHWEGPMQGILRLSLSVLPVPWDGTGNCSHWGTQFPAHSSSTLAIASCCPWLRLPMGTDHFGLQPPEVPFTHKKPRLLPQHRRKLPPRPTRPRLNSSSALPLLTSLTHTGTCSSLPPPGSLPWCVQHGPMVPCTVLSPPTWSLLSTRPGTELWLTSQSV